MNNVLEGPFFLEKYSPESGGVDFLGMRQVNLDMMSECLPGINNVTRYIRPFTLLSWVHWKLHEINKGNSKISRAKYKLFIEKIETLFTWGYVKSGSDDWRLPGVNSIRKIKYSQNQKLPLTFKYWGRSYQNTSLMAAVQYGPSMKSTSGFGFIIPKGNSLYSSSEVGTELAKVLENELKKKISKETMKILENIDNNEAKESQALELWNVWGLGVSYKKEKEIFKNIFYNPVADINDSLSYKRSATISTILEILKRSKKPLKYLDINKALSYCRVDKESSNNLLIQHSSRKWLVLQIRQLHRYCCECLFSWVEYNLILKNCLSSSDLIKAAMEELGRKKQILKSYLKEMTPSNEDIYSILCDINHYKMCMFNHKENISISLFSLHSGVYDNNLIPKVFDALMKIYYFCTLLSSDKSLIKFLFAGGGARISLNRHCRDIERFSGKSLQEYVLYVLEDYILSQHFGVAAYRFDGLSQRLRICIEEDGLKAMVDQPLNPDYSPDRLKALLSLMADCDLIKNINEEYSMR